METFAVFAAPVQLPATVSIISIMTVDADCLSVIYVIRKC